MPGFLMAEVARASLKKRSTMDRLVDSSGCRTLIAAGLPISACSARYTVPMPPWAIRLVIRKLPTEVPITVRAV